MTIPPIAEKDLARFVADTAAAFGWRRYHTHDSRHSPSGFPDEVLVRGRRLIFAELKTEKGKTSAAQMEWLDDLGFVAQQPDLAVYLWRPKDIDRIAELLR